LIWGLLELGSLADRLFLFGLPQSLAEWLHRALADVNDHAIRKVTMKAALILGR
jgi:hypothetical protein